MNNKQLVELQNKIHAQNVAVGWWDDFRSFSRLNNLAISEISEAVEADRKGLNDDKLTQYSGVPVEAADCCIRTFDVLASMGNTDFTPMVSISSDIDDRRNDNDFLLSIATWCLSIAWADKEMYDGEHFRDDICMMYLRTAVYALFVLIKNYNLDPVDLMLEKIEYNKTRADHQRENRAKAGGKKY